MAMEDYFGSYGDDNDEGYDSITCNRCEESDLHWEDRGRGFRLYDEDGKLHVCHKPSADDFEDMS